MRRTLNVLLALAVATGVIIGAGLCATEPANATTAPLLGGVWDASDNPIDDVQVVLYRYNPASATDWAVVTFVEPMGGTFDFGEVPTGTYRVGIRPHPDAPASEQWKYSPMFWEDAYSLEYATDIDLVDGEAVNLRLRVNPQLTGTLTSEQSGLPIEGVTVRVYWYEDATDLTVETASTTTDAQGRYAISVPDTGTILIEFAGNGWAMEYYPNKARFNEAEPRTSGGMVIDESLSPGATFRVDRALSPFGTRMPSAWTAIEAGLPYGIELERRLDLPAADPAQWEPFWIMPARTRSQWPDFLPYGQYRVRFVAPTGTYRSAWHAHVATPEAATPMTADPSARNMVADARFLGRTKASTSIRSSVASVRRNGRARLTVTIRDASITGRTPFALPSAPFRLQRSYDGRRWTTIGGVRRTGSAGTYATSLGISRTTYFRAVPAATPTYYGATSSRVRVRVR
ncbi:MAG: carboxypeptidase regulatory-like domain-containing protein [Coriobacteriia bacterium]|nr:carboxypeptidase regulatory-like domain-containing protein [Coriobacteriia bacterium]